MYYIQYGDVREDGEFIPACGDRAVLILDGRNSMDTMNNDAVEFNGKHRPWYKAYQIWKGESFTRSNALTGTILLPKQDAPVRTAQALEAIKSGIYQAAMEVDEFASLSMDAQGEVVLEMIEPFINDLVRIVYKKTN